MACVNDQGVQHFDGLVPSFDPTSDLEAGIQLYVLGGWPYLLKRCGCPGALEPSDAYEPLFPDQARAWIKEHYEG